MKKELLRINHLNYIYTRTRKFENVSFCILEGECMGFLGLTYSGKDLLTGLLCGELTEGKGSGSIYIGGQKVNDWGILGEKIYRMRPENYMIEEWTVAEYMCLVDARWVGVFFRREVLEEAGDCFAELDLDLDVSTRMRHLSEMEKRIVDVVKAYRRGAKIIIIEDEFDGMSQMEIQKFGRVLHRLILGRMSVIVNSNSNFILSALSDKYIIFNHGHIVKKCAREYIWSEEQLELYFLGESTVSVRENIENRQEVSVREEDIVYRVRNMKLRKCGRENLNFIKGEVVTLIVLDRREKERLFMILSGRIKSEGTHYILNGECYENIECNELSRKKVVSVRALGSREEVFEHMTVDENLMLPSLEKISFWDYIRSSGGIRKMMMEDMGEESSAKEVKAGELRVNECIRMTLERWYIFNPSIESCRYAVDMGFTSAMYDASAKPFEDNVAETRSVVEYAHERGASVEAELGHILTSKAGAAEGNGKSYTREEAYTDPEMAKEFIERTNVDALAIGFGTAHGIYTEKPVLDLNRIALIKSAKDIPYVMHGGSGLSEEEYRTAINNGIRKINYYTYLSLAGGRGVMQYLEDKKDKDAIYFEDIAKAGITAMKADVKRAMKIFESYGKI